MRFLARDGKEVQAEQFASGSRIPKVVQKWDRDGAYYVVQIEVGEFAGRHVRLERGDWVCFESSGAVCDVQQNGAFQTEHIEKRDPVQAKPKPAANPAVVKYSAADLAAEKGGEERDGAGEPAEKPGKAKRAKKKPTEPPIAAVGKLPPLPKDDLELL